MAADRTPEAGAEAAVTIGVIGTGNMGAALVRGWSRALGPDTRLLVWDKIPAATDRVAGCQGVAVAESLAGLVSEADIIVVVVKPKDGEALLRSIAPSLTERHKVVSSMAGVELSQIRRASGSRPALFRVMPNLGVEVGAGMVAVSAEPGLPEDAALAGVVRVFDVLGAAMVVPETMLDAVTALSGTGPALLALALEGLEDGGVAAGLSRASARVFARRAMLGAARVLVAAERSAGELEECLVPSGSALQEGLEILEQRGVRSVFAAAVAAAAQRAREMRAPSRARR